MNDFNLKTNSRPDLSSIVGVSGRVVYVWDLTNNELHWSGNTKTFFPESLQSLVGNFNDYLDLIHPEDQAIVLSRAKIRYDYISLTYRLLTKADTYVLIRDDCYFVLDKDGNRQLVVGLLENMSELELLRGRVLHSESALSDLEDDFKLLGVETEQLKQLLDAAPDGLLLIDKEGEILLANQEAEALFAMSSSSLIGGNVALLVEQIDSSTEIFPLNSKSLAEPIFRDGIEAKLLNENSKERYLELRARPIINSSKHVYFLGLRDISKQKALGTSKDMLLSELDHRVKNTLNIVLSMAKQMLRDCSSLDEFQIGFEGRITALVKTHQLLTQSKWEGLELSELIKSAVAPYVGRGGPSVESEGCSVKLSPRAAQAFYLVLHELSTNSAKYGGFSKSEGKVEITWSVASEQSGASLKFYWREHGGPNVESPKVKGFGSALIDRLIAYQLDGTGHVQYHPAGVICTISVPIGEHISRT